MCFWVNVLACATGFSAGAGIGLFLHLEAATGATFFESKLGSEAFVRYDNDTSTKGSKVMEWLENECSNADTPAANSDEKTNGKEETDGEDFASVSSKEEIASAEAATESQNFDNNAVNTSIVADSYDPTHLELFEAKLGVSAAVPESVAGSEHTDVNSVSTPSQTDSVGRASTLETPRGMRSLSPYRNFSSEAPVTVEEIQYSLDNKDCELVNGSVSNFSVCTNQTSESQMSVLSVDGGLRIKGTRYSVCSIMLNEVSLLSSFMKDRYKGPRLLLHLLRKKTADYLKSWKRDMPKLFHVVFFFDKTTPRLSNPHGIGLAQLLNFLSACQMLESSNIAKVTVVNTNAKYPDGLLREYRRFYQKCLGDANCAAIILAGSSWVRSHHRIDVMANRILTQTNAAKAKSGKWTPQPSVGVVQNLDPEERALWKSSSGRNRMFWDDIFVPQPRKFKEKKADTCPNRKQQRFCADIFCAYDHHEILIPL